MLVEICLGLNLYFKKSGNLFCSYSSLFFQKQLFLYVRSHNLVALMTDFLVIVMQSPGFDACFFFIFRKAYFLCMKVFHRDL